MCKQFTVSNKERRNYKIVNIIIPDETPTDFPLPKYVTVNSPPPAAYD